VKSVDLASFQSAELDEMIATARAAADGYAAEVIASRQLSAGLYILPAGATDDQTPHDEDEVYYAVRGRAQIRVGAEDHAVKSGSLLYVPARAEHHFHNIEEELILVVFWAPPEGSTG